MNRSFLLDTALDLFTSTNFVAATTLFSADFIETFRILLCQSDVDVFISHDRTFSAKGTTFVPPVDIVFE